MDNVYNFTIQNQDVPMVRVEADRDNRKATFLLLTDDRDYLPVELYGVRGDRNNPTFDDLERFIRNRCFPKTHIALDDNLRLLGLSKYDTWDIMRANDGVFCTDSIWCKFDGVNKTWEEVKT